MLWLLSCLPDRLAGCLPGSLVGLLYCVSPLGDMGLQCRPLRAGGKMKRQCQAAF